MSERRLHAVDSPEPEGPAISPGGGGGGGSRIEERLAALETHLQYLATKEDIQKLKIWVLGGVIAAGVAGLGVAVLIVRLWVN